MLDRRRFMTNGLTTVCATGVAARLIADDWPQWRGANRDGRWQETGIVQQLPEGQIPLRWNVPIGGGYSGPVVKDGRVFVTDKQEKSPTTERVLCFNESDGQLIWQHEYPVRYTVGYAAGPRASVTVDQGVAFSLGAMGNLFAFDATSGKILWERDLNTEYSIAMPTWGISSSPMVYKDLLIVLIGGSEGSSVIGLDRNTGKERWRALDDRAQYSAPILIRQANQDVMVAWTGDSVSGLDPLTGKVFWGIPFKPIKMPIGVPTPVVSGDRLFLTSFYDGSLMLRIPPDRLAAEKLWSIRGQDEKKTDALHCMIGTPIFRDGYIYGVDSYGQLRCLDANDGRRIWEDTTATNQERWGTIHMVEQGGHDWLFNELGELILANLSPNGFHQIGRAKLIDPTIPQLSRRGGRGVCWAHPAFANRNVIVRSDERLVSASLAQM